MKKRRSTPPGKSKPSSSRGAGPKRSGRPTEEKAELLRRLQAHQAELQTQNEELREAQTKLEASRNRYSDLYDFAPLGYFTFDREGLIQEVNLTGAEQLGDDRQQILRKPFFLYVAREDQARFRSHLTAVFRGGGRRHCEVKIEGRTPFYAQLESLLVESDSEGPRCRTAVSDITARKKVEEEIQRLNDLLEDRILQRTVELRTANQELQNEVIERKKVEQALAYQATLDPLTGLYNRRYFDLRAEEEIARAGRNGSCLAILLCDLDRFKAINDTLGHQAGDRVLQGVAQGIQKCIREVDLVFRWGGDEMVVLLIDTSREGALLIAERIRREVEKIGKEAQLPLDITIGVAFHPEHGVAMDTLISLADRSLYIAKKGGGKIHVGDEEYLLDERSVRAVFQPIVDLRTRRTIGYEALMRDPHGKLTAPELFKKYQAIGQLHDLKRLCFHAQLKEAKERGRKGERLFLNVDFHFLNQLEFFEKPEGIEIILEISEMEALPSYLIESYLALAEKWRARGFRLAIDDFGAGFVSFPFIAQLVPEYIKIDRSTLLQAVSSPKFRKFLKDLVFALQNYTTRGMIAEGIETEEELAVVREMGVDLVQGFLFGRPEALPN